MMNPGIGSHWVELPFLHVSHVQKLHCVGHHRTWDGHQKGQGFDGFVYRCDLLIPMGWDVVFHEPYSILVPS